MTLKENNKKILIIGDFVLDDYIYVNNPKISREEPILAFKNTFKNKKLFGAAGNVANILANLGYFVSLVCGIGDDENACYVQKSCLQKKINLFAYKLKNKNTIVKKRFIANKKQIFRVDNENIFCKEKTEYIIKKLNKTFLSNYSIVIMSDYGYGIINKKIASHIINLCNQLKIPTIIDPRDYDWSKYQNSFIICPNMEELAIASNIKQIENTTDKILVAGKKLLFNYQIKNLLITRSEKGIMFVSKNFYIEALPKKLLNVIDVTGAGDTVIAALATILQWNLIINKENLNYLNYCGSIAVQQFGNCELTIDDINEFEILSNSKNSNWSDKFLNQKSLLLKLKNFRKKNKTIVFTNGCFDILHFGHVLLFKFAKNYGDILIVGINTDDSIKSLKGENRPIISQKERILLLSQLKTIDEIVLFTENTPENLLKIIKPDIYVKGSEYTKNNLPGASFAKKTIFFPQIENISTTSIINKIRKIK